MKQQMIFVVGCPRSGTTWLQLLLSQHPAITTLQESHIFHDYLSNLFGRWNQDSLGKRDEGLTSILDQQGFERLCRSFVENAFEVALTDKPGASFILEKTPDHIHYAEQILQLFPDAYFVHIVRDPRAVVASLLNASQSWAKHWAPQSALPAAEMWQRTILQGKKVKGLTRRYLEVSYERLLTDTQPELSKVVEMIGLKFDPQFWQQAIEVCSASNLSGANWKPWVPRSMASVKGNTIRKGKADGWKTELTRTQIATVELVTRPLLLEHGYTPTVKPGPLLPMKLKFQNTVRGCSRSLMRGAFGGIRSLVRTMRIKLS